MTQFEQSQHRVAGYPKQYSLQDTTYTTQGQHMLCIGAQIETPVVIARAIADRKRCVLPRTPKQALFHIYQAT
jgi:hypothetical protein